MALVSAGPPSVKCKKEKEKKNVLKFVYGVALLQNGEYRFVYISNQTRNNQGVWKGISYFICFAPNVFVKRHTGQAEQHPWKTQVTVSIIRCLSVLLLALLTGNLGGPVIQVIASIY